MICNYYDWGTGKADILSSLFSSSAVSRNLSFTEKSIVSSEVIETDVVMEEITSHNSESVEYTVQISVRSILFPVFNMIFQTIINNYEIINSNPCNF